MAQKAGVRIVPVSITGVVNAMPPFALAPLVKVLAHEPSMLLLAFLCLIWGGGMVPVPWGESTTPIIINT